MAFTLPKLKYSYDALEPYLSHDVVQVHYDKHTKKYFETMNELIKGTKFEDSETLNDLVTNGQMKKDSKLYNNVLQAYNHSLYWENLAPKKESGEPSSSLLALIEEQWKNLEAFKKDFEDKAKNHFSNGWVWLMTNDNHTNLSILTTHDANNPTTDSEYPLLVVDLWEHSHYLQYPADRPAYLKATWNIIDWNIVNERYKRTPRDTKEKARSS